MEKEKKEEEEEKEKDAEKEEEKQRDEDLVTSSLSSTVHKDHPFPCSFHSWVIQRLGWFSAIS